MSNDLSYKLLKIRQNLSLSQEELADKLGVSFATVNRWENGHSSPRKTIVENIYQLYETAQNEEIVPQKTKKKCCAQEKPQWQSKSECS